MTRETTTARAGLIEKDWPSIIARFGAGDQTVSYPVSEADMAADARFWSEVLSGYGVGPGSRVLVCSSGMEIGWTIPVRDAIGHLNGVVCPVEAWGWDARRFELFCRRLTPDVLLGANRANIDGMAGIVEPSEGLSAVEHLLVHPDAVDPLLDAGISRPGIVVWLGPAAGVSLADGSGIGFDESQWTIDDEDGELVVSSKGNRAADFDRQRTGVAGHVETTAAGPRIVLDELG
ncbi:hypothetical protein [Nocardia sp. NPDC005366]|uniref:hypothetical protein n=1 Tax=Nocardia sp. NPDC005366 TaxID=3156878 RepID=UPI0033B94BE9